MNTNNAVEVKDVKKKFKLYRDKGKMLKERAINWSRNKYDERWVLNGISFEIKKGEAVGLIGHNGCGKSTTLKLLTKIMYPDSGTIEMSGRVSSLLELGAGFHPDLSGRENIYINASIFGLTRHEIDERLEEIIAFSELEEFIDNPVRTYSSGMYMRLAFSVAINVNADILLIDEILAVGDVNFQTKCFNKLMEIKKQGVTIVLVSHSTGQIEQLCERSIWIHDGLIKRDGISKVVDEEYLAYMGEQRREKVAEELSRKNEDNQNDEEKNKNSNEGIFTDTEKGIINGLQERVGTGEVRFTKIKSFDISGKERYTFYLGETIKFQLNYKVFKSLKEAYFGLSIFRNDGVRCYGTNTKIEDITLFELVEDGSISINFPNITLLPGHYYIDVCIAVGMDNFVDYWSGVNEFEIFANIKDIGIAVMTHNWSGIGERDEI